MDDLNDIAVVITGASSGVGRATAHEFARRGANLVLTARAPGPLEDAAAECDSLGGRAVAFPADVTSPDAMRAGDVVVLATPWQAVAEVVGAMGDVRNKIIIDATNPLFLNAEGSLSLSLGSSTSGAEESLSLSLGSSTSGAEEVARLGAGTAALAAEA